MDNPALIVQAMAEQCKSRIQQWNGPASELPKPLQPRHLEWMCDNICRHADSWPNSRLHRWIGFVQCGMLANHMLDLDEAKKMFEAIKAEYSVASGTPWELSEDLLDHLDPDHSFEFDIGGEG